MNSEFETRIGGVKQVGVLVFIDPYLTCSGYWVTKLWIYIQWMHRCIYIAMTSAYT